MLFRVGIKQAQRMAGKRLLTNAATYEPKHFSASIKNGWSNINTFPLTQSLISSYVKEIHNVFGAVAAVGFIFVVWPTAVRVTSNFMDDVPRDKGAQVKLKNFGLFGEEPVVNIQQTTTHLSRPFVGDV